MLCSLTDEQNHAKNRILSWFSKNIGHHAECALAGYAGTGKTTLITHIAAILHQYSIGFLTPTGKAASVIRDKLAAACALPRSYTVSTLHSYLYDCLGKNDEGDLVFSSKSADNIREHDLIIVDEASMVTPALRSDLQALHTPILYVGDPWQLPPVKGGAFTPLLTTDIVLRTVHRQALDNPIVRYATILREGGTIPYGNYDNAFIYRTVPTTMELTHMFEQTGQLDIGFLCSQHQDRVRINRDVRTVRGFRGVLPHKGETLLCLSNDKANGLYNGMQVTVEDVEAIDDMHKCYLVSLKEHRAAIIAYSGAMGLQKSDDPEQLFERDIAYIKQARRRFKKPDGWWPYCFDYGYAMTVHKAQGSEWDYAAMFARTLGPQPLEDYKRMIYTGMTRARKKLYLFNMEAQNKLC